MTLSLATRWPSKVAPLAKFIKEKFGTYEFVALLRRDSYSTPTPRTKAVTHRASGTRDAPVESVAESRPPECRECHL